MAFGRSNSLSLNTGATNSLFGQQNQSTQPAAASSPFGTAVSQPQQQSGGGLFGGQNQQTNTASNSTGGGLFGGSTQQAGQTQQSGGLFGGANQQTGQNQQSGGLFGASTQPSGQNQQSGGLFGGANQQSGQAQQSGGLFGSSTQQTGQAQQSGGLFGNATGQNNTTQQSSGTSLFGAPNQTSNQQSGGSSMFGGLGNQNKPAGSSLFGGSTAQQQPAQNQQSSQFGTSVFDNNNNNANTQSAWKLSMGQGQPQQQTVLGTKIDLSNIRPTTRFSDLHDDIKKSIEQIDNFIKGQEAFASQCEALIPNHLSNVDSVTPDVELISGKVETVELSLENDSREIKAAKDLVNGDAKDLTRCVRVIENLALPSQYHYGPSAPSGSRSQIGNEDYDVDLVGYFTRQAESMQKTLDTFTSNLSEIESHLRVIESNTVQQSQQVAAQRAGAVGGNAAVRELADTLRGFENGILNAAGYVGSCREGVNELIVGRMDGRRRY